MTRRLILIRHAKSGWGDIHAADHDRTLTKRGEGAAKAVGQWLIEKGYIPDLILTSDAMRTRQTTAGIVDALGQTPVTHEIAALYHAAPQTLIDIARAVSDTCVAVVGHNPGIGIAANLLVRTPPAHSRFDDYPTAATTVLDFAEDDWCKPGQGTLVDFIVPHDL